MSRLATTLLILGPAIFTAGCEFDDVNREVTRHKEDFHYSYALKSGGRLELENFNGSVEITGWDKDTVEVNGTKYAPTEDLVRNLKIEVVATPDVVRIRT